MGFVDRLIDEVRRHKILYNPSSSPDYKNALAKDNAWQNISRRLGVSEEYVKQKWKKLCDVYKRTKLRLELRSDSAIAVNKTKWRLYQKMRFLDNVPSTRNTIGSLEEVSCSKFGGNPFEDLHPEYTAPPSPSPTSLPRSSPASPTPSSPPPLPLSPKRKNHEAMEQQFYKLLENASQMVEARISTSSTRQLFDALATRVENSGLTDDEAGLVELAFTECVINKIQEIKNMRH